jgi:hypothetical protein
MSAVWTVFVSPGSVPRSVPSGACGLGCRSMPALSPEAIPSGPAVDAPQLTPGCSTRRCWPGAGRSQGGLGAWQRAEAWAPLSALVFWSRGGGARYRGCLSWCWIGCGLCDTDNDDLLSGGWIFGPVAIALAVARSIRAGDSGAPQIALLLPGGLSFMVVFSCLRPFAGLSLLSLTRKMMGSKASRRWCFDPR